MLHHGIRDLPGHLLLDLEPPGIDFHRPCQLAQSQHLAVGDIGDMRLAMKRQHMMLAHGIEDDVLFQNHFSDAGLFSYALVFHETTTVSLFHESLVCPIAHGKYSGQRLGHIRVHAGKQLCVHPGHPVRRLDEPLPAGILSDSL